MKLFPLVSRLIMFTLVVQGCVCLLSVMYVLWLNDMFFPKIAWRRK